MGTSADAQTHTNSQYDSYGVTDTAPHKYKAVFMLKTSPIYVDVEVIWNMNKNSHNVCLHIHNIQNKGRMKYLYEETARSLSLLELKDTILKHYNNAHTQTHKLHMKNQSAYLIIRAQNETKPN